MSGIILFRGRPGVGKTTISNQLSSRLNLPIIRKDDFYDEVARYLGDHESRNRVSYGILFKILESNMAGNGRFILDFPFNQEQDLSRFIDWLSEHHYEFKSILCTCSNESIWADRFNIRKLNPMPNQLITDFDELKQYYGDLYIKPAKNELVVDTVEALDSIINKIITYLQEH